MDLGIIMIMNQGDVLLYCGDIIGTTIVYEITTTHEQQVTLEYSRHTHLHSLLL